MEQKVICGNNIDLLKIFPDNHFDSIVTDPPYGLGKEPNAEELMKDWIEKGYHEISGSGFMGKSWDAFVPQPIFWKEVFRVLKPGGHVVAFYGTRTYDWGVMAMRFAGFEVRDCIQWIYGSGFPKSYNVGKGIEGKVLNGSASWNDWKKLDGEKEEVNWGYSKSQAEQGYRLDYSEANKERVGKVNFKTEQGKKWEGWGSALKPANEPIVLARKPLEKGLSIAENVLKWRVGGINIDASRVSGFNMTKGGCKFNSAFFESGESNFTKDFDESKGRFPANVILSHHAECTCNGTKKVKSDGHHSGKVPDNGGLYNLGLRPLEDKGNIHAKNGMEEVEDWNCHEDCPIRIMDEQSVSMGMHSAGSKKNIGDYNRKENNSIFNNSKGGIGQGEFGGKRFGDKGGASRFFYCAKASKSERNKGLDGFDTKQTIGGGGTYNEEAGAKFGSIKAEGKNFHPTVKPIKLMQYLVKMITPPNGIVLDPFCGSGTTGVACKLDGFQFVGLEQDPEYLRIAEARINNYVENPNDYQDDIEEKTNKTINNNEKEQLKLF